MENKEKILDFSNIILSYAVNATIHLGLSPDPNTGKVEIDLNKFMELVTENSNLKAEITELKANKEPDNPWQRWIFHGRRRGRRHWAAAGRCHPA